jgi:hypothetical protein
VMRLAVWHDALVAHSEREAERIEAERIEDETGPGALRPDHRRARVELLPCRHRRGDAPTPAWTRARLDQPLPAAEPHLERVALAGR